jgi:hypothetical protein
MKKILCVVVKKSRKCEEPLKITFRKMKPQTPPPTTTTTTTSPSNKRRVISFEETPNSSLDSKDDGDEENGSFPKIQIGQPEEFEPCDVIARVKRRKIDSRTYHSKFQRETFTEPTKVRKFSSDPTTDSVNETVHLQQEYNINTITDEDDDSTQTNEQCHSLFLNKPNTIQNRTSDTYSFITNHPLNEKQNTLQLEYIVDEFDFDNTQQKNVS